MATEILFHLADVGKYAYYRTEWLATDGPYVVVERSTGRRLCNGFDVDKVFNCLCADTQMSGGDIAEILIQVEIEAWENYQRSRMSITAAPASSNTTAAAGR